METYVVINDHFINPRNVESIEPVDDDGSKIRFVSGHWVILRTTPAQVVATLRRGTP